MVKIIGKVRYDTKAAVVLATFDGAKPPYPVVRLCRGKRGHFFYHHVPGCPDLEHIRPATEREAIRSFQNAGDGPMSFEEAFPGIILEDA